MTSARIGMRRRPRLATTKSPIRRPLASSKSKRPSPGETTSGPPIPPGADAPSYGRRLIAWTSVLEPQNPVELYLVERAVHLSWQLDHHDRAPIDRPDPAATPAPADVAAESADRRDRRQQTRGRVLCRILDTFIGLRRIAAREPLDGPAPSPIPQHANPSQDINKNEAPRDSLPAGPRAPTVAGNNAGPTSARTPDASPRRRRPGMRDRQPAWSGRDDRPGPRSKAADEKSRPDRRDRSTSETPPDEPRPRRRVGGYAVPLDPAVPVSCADRIPVKLRREALATRLAR